MNNFGELLRESTKSSISFVAGMFYKLIRVCRRHADETDAGDGHKFGYGFTYVRGGNVAGLPTRGRNGSDASALNWQASKSLVRFFFRFLEWLFESHKQTT